MNKTLKEKEVKIRLSKNRTLFTFTSSVFYLLLRVLFIQIKILFFLVEIEDFKWLLNYDKDLNRFQRIILIQIHKINHHPFNRIQFQKMQIIEWVYHQVHRQLSIIRQEKHGRNSLALRIANSESIIWFSSIICLSLNYLEHQMKYQILVSKLIWLI